MLKPFLWAASCLLSACVSSRMMTVDDLRLRLIAIGEHDQAAVTTSDEAVDATLRAHVDELKAIIASHGWPRISQVGNEAVQAAWLVVQHADFDRAFQREVLAMLEPLANESEVEPKHVGYLRDRIAVGEGLPQTYGTQGRCVGDAWEPFPIEAAESVDERRLSLAMEPLAMYMALGSSLFCSSRSE